MSTRLLLVANVLAAACCLWAWQKWSDAADRSRDSMSRLKQCQQLCEKMDELDKLVEGKLVVLPADFDPTRVVEQRWKVAKLSGDGMIKSEYRARMKEEVGIQKTGITLGQTRATLRQVVDFVRLLSEADANFQVGRLTLQRPRKSEDKQGGKELWDVTFQDVTYLEKDDEPTGRAR